MELRIYSTQNGIAPFSDWLRSLKDPIARAQIRARLTRLQTGNFGDCRAVRDKVHELRVHHGPGYRVYFSRRGDHLVVLLSGSHKAQQQKAIELAVEYLMDWEQRGKP